MTEEQLKHLEFIQNIITRMNTNSFQMKGWAVTIISALLALYASTGINNFLLIGIFPALIFWFLDACYLTEERKFRGLYKDVAGISKVQKGIKPFEMSKDYYVGGDFSYSKVLWSKTEWTLYLPIAIILISAYFCLIIFSC